MPAVDGLAYGLLLFVVAAGLALAFGVAQTLNLAHGLLYAVGGYAAAALSDGGWLGLAVALAAGALAAAGLGGLVALAVHPVAHRGYLTQALLTFGIALIGGDLLVARFGPQDLPVPVPSTVDGSVWLLGHHYPGYRLVLVVAGAGLALGLHLAVARSRAGMLVRALADDRAMVACLGISPLRVRVGVLATAGGLAGAAGVLGAPVLGPGPGVADTVLLLSLIVVVLGGMRSIPGIALAALAVGEIQTLGVALAPSIAPFLLFAAMALVLSARVRRRPA
ncbi:MAG: branched-chain amino acid transport system permease protein [Micromonosporaceae bacterium]